MNSCGSISKKTTKRKVPHASDCMMPFTTSVRLVAGAKSTTRIPMKMPMGDVTAKTRLERMIDVTVSLLRLKFMPSANAKMLLCKATGRKIASTLLVVGCSPMANPSKIECSDSARTSMADLMTECEFGSI